LILMQKVLMKHGMLTEEQAKLFDKEMREIVIAAMEYAENSPWPDPITLEEDVFAP
jgi:pyruvate dehydrogenase E1 component alpha subunit